VDTYEPKFNSTYKFTERLFTPCLHYLRSCKTKGSWINCSDTKVTNCSDTKVTNKQTNKSNYNTSVLRHQIGELLRLFRRVRTLWLETACMSSVDSHTDCRRAPVTQAPKLKSNGGFCYRETDILSLHVKSTWNDASLNTIILTHASQVEGTKFASRIGKWFYYSIILPVHVEEHYDASFRSRLSRFSRCISLHCIQLVLRNRDVDWEN
jgi:hypothetical protein